MGFWNSFTSKISDFGGFVGNGLKGIGRDIGASFGLSSNDSSSPTLGFWDQIQNGGTNVYNKEIADAANAYNYKIAQETNQTNLALNEATNKANAANVAATNEANLKMNADTNAANAANVAATNEANIKMNADTNAINKQIADENLGYQRELFDYNKLLQERIFDREDSSYQRTVADMRKAGLSPLMMSGTNGAGEAIAQIGMNNGYTAQAAQSQAAQAQAGHVDSFQARPGHVERPADYARYSAVGAGLNSLLDLFGTFSNIQSVRESLRGQKLDNDLKERALDADVDKRKYDSERSAYETDRAYFNMLDTAHDHYFNSSMGFHPGMTETERMWRYYNLAFSNKNGDSDFQNILSFTPPTSEKMLKDKGYSPTHRFKVPNRWFGRAFLGANLADDIFNKILGIKSLIPRGPFDVLK